MSDTTLPGGMWTSLKTRITAFLRRTLNLDEDRARITIEADKLRARLDEVAEQSRLQGIQNHVDLVQIGERLRAMEASVAQYLELIQPWLPEENVIHAEPEYYLVAFLYSFLPGRVLVDVGANQGDFAEVVARCGYLVHAFEPYPPAFERLRVRLANLPGVTTWPCAIGAEPGTLPLHIAASSDDKPADDASLFNTFRPHYLREKMEFSSSVDVPVTTLAQLAHEGSIPAEVDFLKTDTEGFDLEVIRGLGPLRPKIIQSEFWGDDFVFVRKSLDRRLAAAAELIKELRTLSYPWNLMIFRIEGENLVRFAANVPSAPGRSWGNLLFFREFPLFTRAYQWCEVALPRFQQLT